MTTGRHEIETPAVFAGTRQVRWRSLFPLASERVSAYASAFGTIAAKSALTALVTTDAATGRAVIPVNGRNFMKLRFYGGDADNETLRVRVWEWRRHRDDDGATDLLVPDLLLDLNPITLGTQAVPAALCPKPLTYFADQITIAASGDRVCNVNGAFPRSFADQSPASVVFDVWGSEAVEIEGTLSGLTGAHWGGMYTLI